jgi:CBS-domain-containing membrane protein
MIGFFVSGYQLFETMKDMQDIEIESEDLHAALEELHQYVDVTEEDLKKIYAIALRHAKERLSFKVPVKEIMTRDVICVKKDADIHEAAPSFHSSYHCTVSE